MGCLNAAYYSNYYIGVSYMVGGRLKGTITNNFAEAIGGNPIGWTADSSISTIASKDVSTISKIAGMVANKIVVITIYYWRWVVKLVDL